MVMENSLTGNIVFSLKYVKRQKEDTGLRDSKGEKGEKEKNIVILNRQLSDQFLS